MKSKNETPEVTDDTTVPKKRISLRREKVKSLKVQTGVQTGGRKPGPGGTNCGATAISCEVSVVD
jgi:hypothetical protein